MKRSRKKYRMLYKLEEQLEIPMFILAIVWLYLFILELVKGLSPFQDLLIYIIWGIFVAEYILKLLLAPDTLRYIKNNWITLIALAVPVLRVLRLLNALRLLQSARFISSTNVIRALTSGKRFFSSLNEAQGPAPEREMHVGVLIEYSKRTNEEKLQRFATQLAADISPELQRAAQIKWHFIQLEPKRLPNDNARHAADFLEDGSLSLAEGPFDALLIITDVLVSSRKQRMEYGILSSVSRIIILSTAKLTATARKEPSRAITAEQVRWNSAKLTLQLFGKLMDLSVKRTVQSKIMMPFVFSQKLEETPQFNDREVKKIRGKTDRLPERELKSGNVLETFIFHILMAIRHPGEVIRPLLRNWAILLPLSLPGLATAAVAPSFILIFTAEIWDVGINMSNAVAAVFAILSIIGASFYLVKIQSLFFPRKEKRVLTEHLAVVNTVIYISIFLACIGLFLMVGGLMLLIETYIFPADLMQTWPTLDKPYILWSDKIRLAVFISTVGVTTGALAGGLESRKVIRHLALFEE